MDLTNLNNKTPFELGETGSLKAIPFLNKYLENGTINEKRLAASAIQKLSSKIRNDTSSIPYLLKNLSLDAPQVRQYTLKALYSLSLNGISFGEIEKIAKADEKEYNRKLAKKILKKYERNTISSGNDEKIILSVTTNTFQKNCVACNAEFDQQILSNVGVLCNACRQQGLFRKKLIITGITRMNQGNVCISGIDPETWRFVRPVYPSGLNRDFIMEGTTQVVRHFNLVEMEFKKYRPDQIHHTEDWLINENFAPKYLGHLKDEQIINILRYMSVNNLQEAIDLQDKSLFIVKVQRITRIWHEQYEKFKVRLNFIDQSGNLFERIPATDLLILAKIRHMVQSGKTNYGPEMINRFNNNPYKYIRIGLTREFMGQHWKQVTAMITIPDMFDGDSFATYEKKLGTQA